MGRSAVSLISLITLLSWGDAGIRGVNASDLALFIYIDAIVDDRTDVIAPNG